MFENTQLFIKEKIKNFGLTRLHRIERYLSYLEETTNIKSKNDKKLILDLKELIENKSSKVKTASVFLVISYIGVYFSFVSFFINDFFLLEEITFIINQIISIFGTTIFLIGIFVFSNLKELYFQDLNLLTAQIISIFTKYHTKEDQHFLEKNNYQAFIDFYKK